MSDILGQILQQKSKEVAAAQKQRSLATLQALVEEQQPALDFVKALTPTPAAPIRVIAECKQRSPSKGVLTNGAYDPQMLAAAYQRGGAAAISVLTDELFFGGHLTHLRAIRAVSSLPLLRKDFIIDPYQIWEARAHGADSFLLLAGVLDRAQMQYFLEVGRELGMEALVESHNAKELDEALATDARLLGINSRNLKTFVVDLNHAKDLLKKYQKKSPTSIFVCESGIRSAQDIAMMQQVGYKAFLVGENLMRQKDQEDAVRKLLAL